MGTALIVAFISVLDGKLESSCAAQKVNDRCSYHFNGKVHTWCCVTMIKTIGGDNWVVPEMHQISMLIG